MVNFSKDSRSGAFVSSARIRILLLFCFALVCIVFLRLYNLQILRGDDYAAQKFAQKRELREISPPRGNIYIKDTAGDVDRLVATNKKTYTLYADPSKIENPAATLELIFSVIEFDKKSEEYINLLSRLGNRELRYVKIFEKLPQEQVEEVYDLDIDGIGITQEDSRYYPSEDLASQVVGFFGESEQGFGGKYGIERMFDVELSGESGISQALPEFDISEERVFSPGADIYLTLDYTVQLKVEQELEKAVEALEAEGATAIFMEPSTGAILAMVNTPSFDLNTYSNVEDISIFNNASVQDVFEPGSIFKPLTMAFAIDAGAISPSTTYNDTGRVVVDDYLIRNFDQRSHGVKTMTQALELSLNTGAVFAMQKMGEEEFLRYINKFHLGEKTEIDLPSEQQNNIRNIANNNIAVNYATATFGQGVAFTSIRLLTSISALANDGVMMKPYIVEKISTKDGDRVTQPEEITRPVSASTAKKITDMLVSTAENGYDRKVKILGYSVAAKTGTAQIPNKHKSGYSEDLIHSFIGYAPAYNPKFIGIIVVKKPKTVRFASDSIAPLFRDISEFLLNYYEIPPDK